MTNDESAIRALVAEWHRATAEGDLDRILLLMSEDAIFLTQGHRPMRGRDTFAAGFREVTARFQLNSSSDIQEVAVSGDLGYCWSRLDVKMTPRSGGQSVRRRGDALSILRRLADGTWQLTRDANMLTLASS